MAIAELSRQHAACAYVWPAKRDGIDTEDAKRHEKLEAESCGFESPRLL